ncbi:unnamed protein product [Strongylus vulgaris]|uniref:Uncharacterized protein n=1 Tax=Strongylus vulgaris TaxID=40348 RepID=A0A3P7IFT2_STRVU|nr:unnamed protein product [Strongylus vulgaris]
MNLYTPSNGLFGTHVTWEDIEEDMQRELDTVASFGPNKTVKNVGDGRVSLCTFSFLVNSEQRKLPKGFMSRIALVEPDWQHKDKQLPEKFIVKEMSELNNVNNFFDNDEFKMALEIQQKQFMKVTDDVVRMISLVTKNTGIHNTEVNVYKHLLQLPQGKFPMTKFTDKPFKELFAPMFTKDVSASLRKVVIVRLEEMEKVVKDILDFTEVDQLADKLGKYLND